MKILIGMPISKDYRVHMGVMQYASYEKELHNAELKVVPSKDCATGRNILIQEMLEGGYDLLYQLDSDTLPPQGSLCRLLEYDKDIMGGVYPLYRPETGPCWSTSIYEPDRKPEYWNPIKYQELPDGLFRAHLVAGGMLLIKRRVFEEMKPPWFERTHMRDNAISQDFLFCVKAKKLGFRLWTDPTIQCNHFKSSIDLKQVFDTCMKQFG